MDNLFTLATSLALLLPVKAGEGAAPDHGADGEVAPYCGVAPARAASPGPFSPLAALRHSSTARQVRIEQRVVVRIAPQPLAARQSLLAELPERTPAPRFEERGKEKCVPLDGIAGVQTGSGNRLVLFLRDQRMMSVNLEKACRARDFYSGFYVEKNKDGRLCVERDRLRSRTGMSCEVAVMRRLVEVVE
jgi:hypothetical protein